METPTTSDALDANKVVAEYRRIVGFGTDLTASLLHGPLTLPVAIAGLADFFGIVFLLYLQGEALLARGGHFDITYRDAGLAFAGSALVGFLVANSGDIHFWRGGRKFSMPLGLWTGLLVRARMKRRRQVRESGPIDAADPQVFGPVVHLWAGPLLQQAEEILGPYGQGGPEDGGFRALSHISLDDGACREMALRIETARSELRNAADRVSGFVASPSGVPAPPLLVLGEALSTLRRSISVCESTLAEGQDLRRNLRQTFGYATGSLEEPIRLNGGA